MNADVCFTCHFLKGSDDDDRVVETTCQNCHEVPDKTIERGLVTINHAEFVSYKANCEDSCHKKQVETQSNVSDSDCAIAEGTGYGPEFDQHSIGPR